MVNNDKNKKFISKEQNNENIMGAENYLDDIDLDLLKTEMNDIKNAINNNSLDLSPEEKIKLQNDFNLIQNIINNNSPEKSHETLEDDDVSEVVDSDDKLFLDAVPEVVDFDDGLVLDDVSVVSEEKASEEAVVKDELVKENVVDFGDGLVLDDVSVVSEEKASEEKASEEEVVDFGDGLVLDDVSEVDSDGELVLDDVSEVDSDGELVFDDENYEDTVDSDMSVDDALNNLLDNYSDDYVIKVENVSMDFRVSKDKIDTLKEFFIRTIKRNKSKAKTVHALKNVSFEIKKGDRVGIIGFNGAGKSTLLKVLAGVYYPTEGKIETKGKIAPLLSLGAGFDMNYTGRNNIFLNGAFLGFPEEFLKEKFDEIVEFSELGDSIDYHVKTYSSGMRAKLGFSIATIVEPDILIIDEILSVGDIKFRRKSSDKIKSLINSGITVLLVSHSVGQIRELCNKAIWIDNGELVMSGNVNEVCDEYVKAATKATSEQLENIKLK